MLCVKNSWFYVEWRWHNSVLSATIPGHTHTQWIFFNGSMVFQHGSYFFYICLIIIIWIACSSEITFELLLSEFLSVFPSNVPFQWDRLCRNVHRYNCVIPINACIWVLLCFSFGKEVSWLSLLGGWIFFLWYCHGYTFWYRISLIKW